MPRKTESDFFVMSLKVTHPFPSTRHSNTHTHTTVFSNNSGFFVLRPLVFYFQLAARSIDVLNVVITDTIGFRSGSLVHVSFHRFFITN